MPVCALLICLALTCTGSAQTFAKLVSLTGSNAANPLFGVLAQGTDGVVFPLNTGLSSFVATVPRGGAVGTSVKILGTKLTGATSVTFMGTAAAFTVVSATEIKTTVPTGATSGTVEVVTPSR